MEGDGKEESMPKLTDKTLLIIYGTGIALAIIGIIVAVLMSAWLALPGGLMAIAVSVIFGLPALQRYRQSTAT